MAVASSLRGEGISNQRTRLSTARMLNVAALLVGAAGILMQYFFGVGGFPRIPPGPNFLAVAAAVVALGPWRWTPVVGIRSALCPRRRDRRPQAETVEDMFSLTYAWLRRVGRARSTYLGQGDYQKLPYSRIDCRSSRPSQITLALPQYSPGGAHCIRPRHGARED